MITQGICLWTGKDAGLEEGLSFWGPERSKAGSASNFLDDFVSKTNISKLSLYARHIFSSLS